MTSFHISQDLGRFFFFVQVLVLNFSSHGPEKVLRIPIRGARSAEDMVIAGSWKVWNGFGREKWIIIFTSMKCSSGLGCSNLLLSQPTGAKFGYQKLKLY